MIAVLGGRLQVIEGAKLPGISWPELPPKSPAFHDFWTYPDAGTPTVKVEYWSGMTEIPETPVTPVQVTVCAIPSIDVNPMPK
jgi:hypothetical protein